MAGMGTKGIVNVTPEMMDSAISAINTYRDTAKDLHSMIQKEVTNLTAQDFKGSAANGFMNFYNNNINPATGQSVTGILDTLDQICKSIKAAIPDSEGVDEQLAQANNQ